MPYQLGSRVYEKDELLRKRAAAERSLTTNNTLSAEQRQQLLNLIQHIDSALATGSGTPRTPNEADIPSVGLNIISFLFPLVGLILFCVFSSTEPNKAHSVGKWALIGFCVGIGLSTLLYLSSLILLSSLF